jgi:hypothetical protein
VTHRVLFCEACGGPLDAPWAELVIVCGACGAQNLPGRPGGPVPSSVPVDGRPRINLGGRAWVIEGRLAEGDSSVVYRGRWASRLGEAVVVKVVQALADADLLAAEWSTLTALQASRVEGASHFRGRLPVPVARGIVDTDRPRAAMAYGWKSGFVHTLTEVGQVHPTGVPGPVQVWLLKRLLELLGFVHRSGFVHGAVTPDHVLVHPRDHGATLVGWTAAVPVRAAPLPLPARPRRWLPLYDGVREGTPTLDIAMACRCAREAAGPRPADRDAPVAAVIAAGARGEHADAWALAEQLSAASREAYGPPAYHPLRMVGW